MYINAGNVVDHVPIIEGDLNPIGHSAPWLGEAIRLAHGFSHGDKMQLGAETKWQDSDVPCVKDTAWFQSKAMN